MYVIFLSESAWLTTSTRWIDFSKVGSLIISNIY